MRAYWQGMPALYFKPGLVPMSIATMQDNFLTPHPTYPEVAIKPALNPTIQDGEVTWSLALEFAIHPGGWDDFNHNLQRSFKYPEIQPSVHPFFSAGENLVLNRDDWDVAESHCVCEALALADWI